jgi:hypothetical protein
MSDLVTDAIDRSLPSPPSSLPSPAERLAAGRRGVRRRRLAGGALLVAVTAGAVVVPTFLLDGAGPDAQVADGRGTSATESPAPTRPPGPDEWDGWDAGLVKWDGEELRTREGVTVVQEVLDPMQEDLPSLGLVLRRDGVTTWMLLSKMDGGRFATWTDEADSGWATFEQWLADSVALQDGSPANPAAGIRLVTLDDSGAVVPDQPGVVVLEQQGAPDLPRYGTDAKGAASAVALLEWEGLRWFVLAVRVDGRVSVTPVAVTKAEGATTLDEFVAFMAASESGMR